MYIYKQILHSTYSEAISTFICAKSFWISTRRSWFSSLSSDMISIVIYIYPKLEEGEEPAVWSENKNDNKKQTTQFASVPNTRETVEFKRSRDMCISSR